MDNKYTKFKTIYLIVISAIVVISIIAGCYYHLSSGINFKFGKHSFSSNSGNKKGSTVVYEESKTLGSDIKNITIKADVADLSIEYGDAYKVDYRYVDYNAPQVEVDGKNLKITEKAGIKSHPANVQDIDCTLKITIPEGCTLEDIDIDIDCGNIQYEDIICEDLILDADLGNIQLEHITCDDLKVNADLGNVEFTDSTIKNIEANADCGAITFENCTFKKGDMNADLGSIVVSGDFESLKASCNLGSIDIVSIKPEDDLDLDLKADLGSITVNGKIWK